MADQEQLDILKQTLTLNERTFLWTSQPNFISVGPSHLR
jgi:hypothetical protein